MLHIVSTALGYLASILLAISLMVNNDLKFRWLNTFGCLSFILYGIFIQAMPVILTNSLLLLINVIYLIKIYRAVEIFDLIEFSGTESLVHKFLSFHQNDIQAYFPDFKTDEKPGYLRFVVLRDLVIANMFVAKLGADGRATVTLNYTVPKYRDYKVGRYIFDREKKFLLSKGVREVTYEHIHNKKHLDFLMVMGFTEQKLNGQTIYSKTL